MDWRCKQDEMLMTLPMPVRPAPNIFGRVAMFFQPQSAPNNDYGENQQNCNWNQFKDLKHIHIATRKGAQSILQGLGWGLSFGVLTMTVFLAPYTPAHAQSIELVTETPDYQIMRVQASKVCFAVHNGTSAKDAPITFATYKTKAGDRWQVAGFVDDTTITAKSDMLTIRFDDTPLITRGVEFSRGDFILPFTETADLDAYDAKVIAATEMTLQLQQTEDTITLNLNALRTARTQIETCLEGIK